MRTIVAYALLIGAVLLILPVAASAEVEIYGDALVSYRDGDTGTNGAQGNGTFQLDQVDLAVYSDLTQYASVYARGTFTPGNSAITEAWISLTGLPYDMKLTAGRYYRPLGVRLPTVGQSYPSVILHSFSDLGVKLEGERDWLNWEVGISNGHQLSTTAATIGNLPVLANASAATDADQDKEIYGHVGISVGEPWGSLDLGFGVVSSRLNPTERAILAPLFNTPTDDKTRTHFIISADYTYRWFNLFGEYDILKDGQLERRVWTTAATIRYRQYALTLGYDELHPRVDILNYYRPISWERSTFRVTGRYEITPTVVLQSEWQSNDENLRDPNGNRIENDMWISQLLVYF